MDILQELDPSLDGLEPQFRERSNTWPLRPNRVDQNGGSPTSEETGAGAQDGVQVKQEKGGPTAADPLGLTVKKSGARRNAWGALSYAELISNAIQSSPEKRLTLSQIYDWMVQNVPYFKDKGDSTSSAGWKNSIRHNLSLHSRFMRIQNEGTGKSSWWVINPDAKPNKGPRRRAGSMDTKSGEKKRGRINKKRQEAMKTALLENRGSPLNGSIDFLDTLALGDFRSRASSNASSCSRLSPIPPDLHDNQVPPMSPIPWDGEMDVSTGTFQVAEHFPDLVNSLADSMNLSSQENMDVTSELKSDPYLSSGVVQEFSNSPTNIQGLSDGVNDQISLSHLPAPPPYPERTSPVQPTNQSPSVTSPKQPTLSSASLNSDIHRAILDSLHQLRELKKLKPPSKVNLLKAQAQLSVNTQQETLRLAEGLQQNSPSPQTMVSHLSPTIGQVSPQEKISPVNQQLSPQQQQALLGSSDQQTGLSVKDQQQNALQQNALQQQQRTKSILRSALTHGSLIFTHPAPTSQLILGQNLSTPGTDNTTNVNVNLTNLDLSPQHQIQQKLQQQQPQQLTSDSNGFLGQLNGTGSTGPVVNNIIMRNNSDLSISNNNVPVDVDMDSSPNFMSMSDQDIALITQDLILDGNLDTNFDNITPV